MRRLPPRLDMFVRYVGGLIVAYLAIGGALAIYDGHAKLPHWWMIAASLVGGAFGHPDARDSSEVSGRSFATSDRERLVALMQTGLLSCAAQHVRVVIISSRAFGSLGGPSAAHSAAPSTHAADYIGRTQPCFPSTPA